MELQAGGSEGTPDVVVIGGRQGEVENVDPSPTFGRVESEVEHLLAVLSALRGSIGEALGKVRQGGERKRKGGGGEEAGEKTLRVEEEELGEGRGEAGGGEAVPAELEALDVDMPFTEIDIGTALWGGDGDDEKSETLVGVEDMVQSLEGLLQEAMPQGGRGEEEEEEEAELKAWLDSDPLPRIPSPPPHWGGEEVSLSAWREVSPGERHVARVLLYGGATPLPLDPTEGHRLARGYAAERCQEEIWTMLHHVLCWSPCPPPWLSAVTTGLLEALPSSDNPSLHQSVLRALGGEGQSLEALLKAVATAACNAAETGEEGETGEVGRSLQVLAAQLVSRVHRGGGRRAGGRCST